MEETAVCCSMTYFCELDYLIHLFIHRAESLLNTCYMKQAVMQPCENTEVKKTASLALRRSHIAN